MHAFFTLSTPHLGNAHGSSRLVSAGLWVIRKLSKSASLLQLQLGDASDVRESALYQLSSTIGLEWFTHVAFCSSQQDGYVPQESALV